MAHAVGTHRAEQEAMRLLAENGIHRPPVDPVGLARRKGMLVVYENLPSDTSSVLIREPSGRRLIGINSRHSPTRQRFSTAHELGHALLHFDSNKPAIIEAAVSRPLEVLFRDGVAEQGTDRVEIDANVFAASLLMPAELIRGAFRSGLEQDRRRSVSRVIEELATDFDVSEQALRYRLINLHLIDPA